MKLPICQIDAQTNTLCRKCKALLREGKISDSDIELSKFFVDLSKSHKDLKTISFFSSIELDDIIVIVTRKQDVPILSSKEILTGIKEITQKDIRFLEKTNDPKKLVESLLDPVSVVNVTVLYIPPFSDKEYKIELSAKDKNLLPIPEEILVQTVSSILNTGVYVDYV